MLYKKNIRFLNYKLRTAKKYNNKFLFFELLQKN